MANYDIKDLTINLIWFGLLFFSLTTFTISFILINGGNLYDVENVLNTTQEALKSNLIEVEITTGSTVNMTAQFDPEKGMMGDKSQVANAFDTAKSGTKTWNASLKMLRMVLGDGGVIIISVISGIIALTSGYFIFKMIRGY